MVWYQHGATWSLRFEDRDNADNFARIVHEESSLKTISNDNEAMSSEKVDADHMSDSALPNRDHEDDIPLLLVMLIHMKVHRLLTIIHLKIMIS